MHIKYVHERFHQREKESMSKVDAIRGIIHTSLIAILGNSLHHKCMFKKRIKEKKNNNNNKRKKRRRRRSSNKPTGITNMFVLHLQTFNRNNCTY